MNAVRLLALVLVLAGVLVVGYGFYDMVVADERLGTPTGWYLLPVGGLLAVIGLGLLGRQAHHASAPPFTEEELERGRRERGSGD
jgi:hypothetical protein